MYILGIDTSGSYNSLALLGGSGVRGELALPPSLPPSKTLLPAIDKLLRGSGCSLSGLGGIALASGPGSFTGLRVGVAVAKGLSWVHSLPLVGINTLDALAVRLAPPEWRGEICSLLDAKQGEVYAALYRCAAHRTVSRVSEDLLLSPRDLAGRIKDGVCFVGEGVAVYREVLEKLLPGRAVYIGPEESPCAAVTVARLGREKIKAGEGISPFTLRPHYIRRSAAEAKEGAKRY